MAHPQILQLPATAHQQRQRCRKLHQKLGLPCRHSLDLCRPRRLPTSPAAAAPAAAAAAVVDRLGGAMANEKCGALLAEHAPVDESPEVA
mmetsp:Transcript_3936/g.9866  ORF Transcript_3936/g.9866 Transcript_3936/m.9866 type:complete len:90 (-) Transcript_3936:12-281(-)